MSVPYPSGDAHAFREWDGKREELREYREKMARFVPPPVQEEPTERPHQQPDEGIEIEVGSPPTIDTLPQAELYASCHSRGAIHSEGQAFPQHVWDWIHMHGDPVHIGRVLMAACEAYIERMEAENE